MQLLGAGKISQLFLDLEADLVSIEWRPALHRHPPTYAQTPSTSQKATQAKLDLPHGNFVRKFCIGSGMWGRVGYGILAIAARNIVLSGSHSSEPVVVEPTTRPKTG